MHFLITAGGTREYIDPVRFISNASTGRMGYALAKTAFDAGHKVTLISASDLQPPIGMEFVGVESAQDMFNAAKEFFPKCDCLIMAAAVSDYTPVRTNKTKIKRTDKALTIKLKPTPDILKWAGRNKKVKSKKENGKRIRPKIVVGFALEEKNLRANAEKKMKEKNLDMIIVNTPAAIGADRISVQIKIVESPWIKIENATKATIARRIISLVGNI
jgi:phosphopantothenoylcysteine decarboxylase/phosphopantothenate--cysteine ligase